MKHCDWAMGGSFNCQQINEGVHRVCGCKSN